MAPPLIYGVVASPWTMRVVLACAHKGVRHTLRMPEGGTRTPQYLALNPLGKMPTLVDGKLVLFESAALLEYLERKHRRRPLLPRTASAAARARQIAAVCDAYLQDQAANLFRSLVGQRPDDPVYLDDLKAEIGRALDVLEGLLAKGRFALGATFSLADCYLVPALYFTVRFAPKHGVADPLAGRVKLQRYWAGIRRHKTVAPVLAGADAFFAERLKGTKAA
jgi:glutathione S-transferase